MDKSVSVIIVNFNAGSLLLDCVRRVLASTISVEVLIADNASYDRSIDLLKTYFKNGPRLKIVLNQENLGFAAANNKALAFAKGEYLLFLNPDCVIRPDTIERLVIAMEANPQAAMGGCLIRNADGTEQAGCRRNTPTPWRSFVQLSGLYKLKSRFENISSINMNGDPLPSGPVEVEAISGAMMLVRRTALDKVGPMDDGYFLHCEDLDWCMRFRRAGYKVIFLPDLEIMHIKGVCYNGKRIFVEWHKHKGMIRYYRKFFQDNRPVALTLVVYSAVMGRFLALATAFGVRRFFLDRKSIFNEASNSNRCR